MPLAATWLDLEMIILSEIRQTEKDDDIGWYHLYVESKKPNTHKLIYKTETDPQTLKTNWWLPRGKVRGEDKLGYWD